ncbi:glycosyltransferase family 87 protein [Micromonospora sp. WMMD1102]|uniref:glycosyltransferase family 87 protein n=1 Tax=Micromonospora sp. WMMD1102 TaxID=3016105 RepID=UPI002414D474|nr:glycosyltransferase family 87 protein [Micromonospora sp. WMMD1102]MDG4785283.1 glycosyltransferase family 87 protein [Micromonospora sp. WMMD1102]
MPADPAAPSATDEDDPGGRSARQIIVVVLVAAAVPLLYLLSTPHNFYDLKIYMSAMRWWADGNPLYDYAQADDLQGQLFFTYPPFTALLLRPFVELRIGVTAAVFTALTVLALLVTTWWLVASVADRHGVSRWFAAGLAVPLVFAVESTRETIIFGQINMLLVVLVLADLLRAVPRNSRWAGVGIGLATALKLYPGIFIVYLLVTRRWRAALVSSAAAAGATLLAAAIAPTDSWRFWTHELWLTDRVGRPDYTGNQSLFGLLNRFTTPEEPNQLLWLVLVVAVGAYGLWRAAQAAQAGDEVAGLTLTGLVAVLVSPITWTHHAYWFIPAVVVLVDAGLRSPDLAAGPAGRRRRVALLTLAALVTAVIVYGVVSYYDWGRAYERTDAPGEFLLRNLYVLFALLLLVVLPIRRKPAGLPPGPATQVAKHEPSSRQ